MPDLLIHRITFTLPLLNSARVVVFLDTDEAKAQVLRNILEPGAGDKAPPAAQVRPSPGEAHWFLTQGAAKLLRAVEV